MGKVLAMIGRKEHGMTVQTTARNASLEDLATLLKEQHARKLDVVAPASKIRSAEGTLVIRGAEAVVDDDGVTQTDGEYVPTAVCDEGIAEKLQIPVQYLRRMRAERVDLYDANVNGWLHGRNAKGRMVDDEWRELREAVEPDVRSFLVRCFRGDDGETGIARAFLSQSFKMIDNLDVLTAALDGVRQTGTQVEIDGCDLTDRRMYVRIVAPEIRALAPTLLRSYRSPFADPAVEAQRHHGDIGGLERGLRLAEQEGMGYGGKEPIVFAGFVLSNSETGGGAFSITPRLVIQVCKNGLTITKDALRSVHLGAKMDEGVVRWSDDTQQKNLQLVTAKTRDAVATFLDVDYMTRTIERIEEQSTTRLAKPADDVRTIGKKLAFSQQEIDGVLDHFVRGGDTTAGGLMNAVTSYAQTVRDADAAMDLEAQALRVLEVATSL